MLLLDQNNLPQLFYHGTRKAFDQIAPNAVGLIHFSSSKKQAEEFAEHIRGEAATDNIGPSRIIEAHLQAENPFDPHEQKIMQALLEILDMNQVLSEAEDLSQSPWTSAEIEKWFAEGQWQMLELPCVLAEIKQSFDGIVMYEMGCRLTGTLPG
jgi:hypothetical protein